MPVLRLIGAADIPAVKGLEKARLAGRSLGLAELAAAANGRGYLAVVASDDAGLGGYALAQLESPEAELYSIAVRQDLEGQGLGTKLLLFLEQNLQARGITRILLEVAVANTRAVALYRKNGYTQYRIRVGYYAGQDALCMDKRLK